MGIESATGQHLILAVFPLKIGNAAGIPTTVDIPSSIFGWSSVAIDTIKVCVSERWFLLKWQGMLWGNEQHAASIELSIIAISGNSIDIEAQQQHVRLSHGSFTMAAAPTISRQKNTTKNHTNIFRYFEFITGSFKDSIMDDDCHLALLNRYANPKS